MNRIHDSLNMRNALRDGHGWELGLILLAQQHPYPYLDLDDGVKGSYPKFDKALAKIAGLS